MSKVADNTTAVKAETLKKKYQQFDENLNSKTVDVTLEFTKAPSIADAMLRLNNDEKSVLAALNARLKRVALNEKRREVGGEGIPSKVVLASIKDFRLVEPFASEKDRKKQTEMILDEVRKTPFMLKAIQAKAAKLEADEAEDDEDGDETE